MSRLSRVVVAIVSFAAAVALGFAVGPAFGGHAGTHPNGSPLVSGAQQMASIERADGRVASVWRATATDGRICAFVQTRTAAAAAAFDPESGSETCTTVDPMSLPNHTPIQAEVDWTLNDRGTYDVLINGRVDPSLNAASLSLNASAAASGGRPLRIGTDGYFVVDLPAVATAGALPASQKDAQLVAYDVRGNIAASFDIAALLARMRSR